jgi:hypothetical protein
VQIQELAFPQSTDKNNTKARFAPVTASRLLRTPLHEMDMLHQRDAPDEERRERPGLVRQRIGGVGAQSVPQGRGLKTRTLAERRWTARRKIISRLEYPVRCTPASPSGWGDLAAEDLAAARRREWVGS